MLFDYRPKNILKGLSAFFITVLVFLTVSRFAMAYWQFDRLNMVDGWWPLIYQGIRVDIATCCWIWGLAILGTFLFSYEGLAGNVWRWILRIWCSVGFWSLVMLEVTTPTFINEYGVRPNRLFVEYLIYPKEVFSMLWAGRKIEFIFTIIIAIAMAIFSWRLTGRLFKAPCKISWKWRPVLAVLAIAMCFLGARSTFQHRPLNPGLVAFSTDPLVNSLAVNSFYSLAFAISQMSSEADASKIYGKMDTSEMIDIVRKDTGRNKFLFDKLPTETFNQATYQGKPKNLVILLQESLGSQFVGSLGGLPLTPNIDALSHEGWFFHHLYATGTRSVRGIEAVVTGFTPTPARSVVKLGKSQSDFFTIADLLKKHGYASQFIYGGESHFDNMKTFFLGNGFTNIVDQNDYKNPKFEGSWGVSDEDLMEKANSEFTEMQKQGKPFFSLVFSSSNHDPFEYPDGRIAPYEKPKQTRNNAAKYADYAIGEFFKLAKKSNYWKDTVFLIIADHDSRVTGANLVPVNHFRIPGLIIGDGIKPRLDNRVVSQIDMPTTLLSLIGISDNYPMIGRDLTRTPDNWAGRAMMQYDKNFAYMQGNNLVILQPEHAPIGYQLDASGQLQPKEQSEDLKKKALATVLWGSYAYQHSLYKPI